MYFDKLLKDVRELESRVDKIYVYGAGFYGKDVCKVLMRNNISIEGFIVTKIVGDKEVLGLPLIEFEKVKDDHIGIVLGLNDTYLKEVLPIIEKNHFNMENVVDGGKYIFGVGGRGMIRNRPIIEVTTGIGCPIDCKFCPQKLFVQRYYENDKNRKRMMTLEDFKIYLKHSPQDSDFIFAGMSEPLLNKECIPMMKMACEAGRKVSIYTTLVGADKKDIEELVKLPLDLVVLHVPDKYEYAHIPVSKEYFEMVEFVLNAKKDNGEPFVGNVNAQAEPIEKIRELCKGKYEVMTSLHDRAGNLEGDNLSRREIKITNEKIYCCSCGTELNNQVLLPDGTMVLCNMDFGLQHQLGNLLEHTYEEVRAGEEMKRIRQAMNGDTEISILCRNCCLCRLQEENKVYM